MVIDTLVSALWILSNRYKLKQQAFKRRYIMQPSQEYYDLIDSYKVLHEEEGKFKGISLTPLVPTLIHVTKENNCKTLLDYGCGKAIPYDKDRCKEVGLRNPVQRIM